MSVRSLFQWLTLLLVFVKGIGVGIFQDAARMAVDHPGDQLLQGGIFLHQRQIRPDLRRAVAQPHGVDVAGNHVGVGPAIHHLEIHRRVERVREAILEQPRQLLVADRGP